MNNIEMAKARLAQLKAKHCFDWSELNEVCDLEEEILQSEIDAGTKAWGEWRYDPSDPPSIDYAAYDYQIVLSRIDTAAKLGDWLLHLGYKTWVTPADLGNLVKALQDLEYIGYHSISGRGQG